MQPSQPSREAMWLRASRGEETQERLAQDIKRVTGWGITRDRYSKYESGTLPIGKKVLGHFVDYWASRGVAGPDAFSPMASPGEVATQPGLAALVSAIGELVQELRLSRAQQDESTVALLAALAAVLPSAQVPRGTRDGTEPEAHAGTGQRP